jgi:hypothetical protein
LPAELGRHAATRRVIYLAAFVSLGVQVEGLIIHFAPRELA